MWTDKQLAEFRSHFPILREKTYLYNCSQGALSDEVAAALEDYARSWRSSIAPWEEWIAICEQLRTEFAHFIHADHDEVALVTSASAGINPIASALSFEGRNQVVMGEYEFPTMGHIWLAQRPRGAEVRFLHGADNALPPERYQTAIGPRTRMVAVTQVSFINGYRADVPTISRIAHENGALMFLDAFQDCGTRPVDVKALGVDFFVTGTLKYLLGPPGLGFLYVRRDLIESLAPTVMSWVSQRDPFAFDPQRLDPSPTARRFDGGTPPVGNIYMARAALRLLQRFGMEGIAAQIASLTRAFLKGAEDLRIQSKTQDDSVGPLVVLRAVDAGQVVLRLAAHGIAVSARKDGVRFAFHAYNTMEDVHKALTALEENLDLMVRGSATIAGTA
jgi:selenocysteine lyase/cysteine desulfurase